MNPRESGNAPALGPDWIALQEALEQLPVCLADLRSPIADRFLALGRVLARAERSAIALIDRLVAHRDRIHPDPAAWDPGRMRFPQTEPTLTLALREWILSLGSEPAVPLNRQKRLAAGFTEILVARAAILAYSERLHEPGAGPLVRMLGALWLLVAECWKTRPLLGTTDRTEG